MNGSRATGDNGALDTARAGFGVANLPYGVFTAAGQPPAVGVAIGDQVLGLATLAAAGLLDTPGWRPQPGWFAAGSLNAFMAAGPVAWQRTRARLTELLTGGQYRDQVAPHLTGLAAVSLLLPFEVADYVDFYSSREHAETVGRIFRPDGPPLPANWLHLPAGYHGRAGSVVVSGTPVRRPCGLSQGSGRPGPALGSPTSGGPVSGGPGFGPSARLDYEAEVGFVVGTGAAGPVGTGQFAAHVFGVVLVNDWSARDIQEFESRPLGPFLGKSFATSVSPWVVPLAALDPARVTPPRQDPPPAAYLACAEPWGLDIRLEISINGHTVSRPPFRGMYWTGPQQLAHATVNGARLRTGDLLASGTVSGPGPAERGCLLEHTRNGTRPLLLPDGTRRGYLEDGDTVTVTATAPGADGATIGFGQVTGTIVPA